ncbi:MAG: GTPase Era [Ignavibacteriales bacterium]|nr:GTPase Era [Ignavibacteriales bacterium]
MSNATALFRAGYVAIIGEPNVGKSTLINALLGQKISIVTRKPQTTRQRVLGILTLADAQMIFLDTPGILEPKYLLQETMMRSARRALEDADVILVLTDAGNESYLSKVLLAVVKPLQKQKPLILAINKVDTLHRDRALPMIAEMAETGMFEEIVPISALKTENLDRLLESLKSRLPEHPALYPEDLVSEQPERFFVAEIIREKIFEKFHEEIPYSTAVEIREFKEREEGKTYINADIIVERASQKGILIGAKGSALKAVGQLARKEIEEFIGKPVFLELFVKVGEQWRKSGSWMKRLGYSEE